MLRRVIGIRRVCFLAKHSLSPPLCGSDRHFHHPPDPMAVGTHFSGQHIGPFPLEAHHALRIALIVFTGIVLSLVAVEPAVAVTPKALLQSCGVVAAGARVRRAAEVEVPRTGLTCWFYMSAVQNMSVLTDEDGEPLLGICAPASTTLLDYVRIFVRYARRHRNDGAGNAAALVVEALNSAFPCGRRDTASSRLPGSRTPSIVAAE
jgi:Rap1a immunity proteins